MPLSLSLPLSLSFNHEIKSQLTQVITASAAKKGYSWADEILLDSLLESSNYRRDFDENY